jgi:adenosylcobinamide-phosphate synthase
MTLLIAWLLDATLGEPPTPLHPVIGMGTYLHFARRHNPRTVIGGALFWLGGAGLDVGIALVAQWLISLVPFWPGIILTAFCLKPLFAWRALRRAAEAVLDAPDLPDARKMLAWHLVSRDTSDLSAGEVYGAAIESVAENFSDSVVAPLFYFLIGGLPLAALYRYANTADALWGYRTAELERFGKVAARVDDLLNLIPSRLSALLLCIACGLLRLNVVQAWRIWIRDAWLTPSPNAGQPMSAAAGALGVQLRKRGLYLLGAEFPEPAAADVQCAIRLASVSGWLFVLPIALIYIAFP